MNKELLDFIEENSSQIFTLISTLSGTFLGWILCLFQENVGKIEVIKNELEEKKMDGDSYCYKLPVFICNQSARTKYIRNIEFLFYCDDKIIKDRPRHSEKNINFSDVIKQDKIDYIFLKHNEPVSFYLCNKIETETYQTLSNASKIVLAYINDNNKTKKIIIKNQSPFWDKFYRKINKQIK